MKNYFLAILFLTTISCNNDEAEINTVEIPVTYWESSVELRVQDSEGKDLLNSQNQGYFKESEIEILENDNAVNAVSVNEYSPETDYFYLKLNLNYPKPDIDKGKQYDEELISEITFGNNEADEIKELYEIKYSEGNEKDYGSGSGYTVILQKAWFNDKQIYEIQSVQNTDWELPIIIKEPQK